MTEQPRLVLAVLAAGRSVRFGTDDKLTADLGGKMLGRHVTDTLAQCAALHRWVIARGADHPCAQAWREAGFDTHVNESADRGLGTSVAAAAQLAREAGAHRLLIALADMPLVPLDHFEAVIGAAGHLGEDCIVATDANGTAMPPACFGQQRFPLLAALGKDTGARALLAGATRIPCQRELLVDVDDRETLERLARGLARRSG